MAVLENLLKSLLPPEVMATLSDPRTLETVQRVLTAIANTEVRTARIETRLLAMEETLVGLSNAIEFLSRRSTPGESADAGRVLRLGQHGLDTGAGPRSVAEPAIPVRAGSHAAASEAGANGTPLFGYAGYLDVPGAPLPDAIIRDD